jgi:histidinol phosphatase-like enzyme
VYEFSYSEDFSAEKPLLILDRDSTIIEDFAYTWRKEDLQFIPGALDSLRFAAENNFLKVSSSSTFEIVVDKSSQYRLRMTE